MTPLYHGTEPPVCYTSHDAFAMMEQFAASIAALARQEAAPEDILHDVLSTIAENMNASQQHYHVSVESLLEEKAQQAGYGNLQHFHTDLLQMIRQQMFGLQLSELTAMHREHLRTVAESH